MRYVLILLLLLAGCETKATPLPVSLPTPSPTPGPPPPVRYGVAVPDLLTGVIPLDSPPNIETIAGPVNTDDLGQRFDIIIAPGIWPDAERTPIEIHTALVINTLLPPLDNPALPPVIGQLARPQSLSELDIPGISFIPAASDLFALRGQLANAGWPDGFDLTAALPDLPGRAQITGALAVAGIQLRLEPVFSWERTHLALIQWAGDTPPVQWAQVEQVELVRLYSIPVSYWAVPGLEITFTPAGWPVARWSPAP
jgi:hypothetical protein